MIEKSTKTAAILYNVTVKVDAGIAAAWLQWSLSQQIPAVLQTGCFFDFKLVRLLEVDDTEGPTYAIQYFAESKADYNRYMSLHAATFLKQAFSHWGDAFIAFNSVMEILH